MDQVTNFIDWLFGTRPGVGVLFAVGIVFFFVLAMLLEKKTRMVYHNHEKDPNDDSWSFFDDEDYTKE